MADVPSSSRRRVRSFLQHAPWFAISLASTVTGLALTSLVVFKEEKETVRPGFVLSGPRDALHAPKIETPLDDAGIVAAPIPIQEIKPQMVEDPRLDPWIEELAMAPISDRNRTIGEGDLDEESVAGPEHLPPGIDRGPDSNLFISIGTGNNSGLGKRGGGTGTGSSYLSQIRNPGTLFVRPDKHPAVKETLEGLLWLARHQSPDGSWDPVGFSDRCAKDGERCEGFGRENHIVGCTGLALLAFLGAGFHQFQGYAVFDSFRGQDVSFRRHVVNGLQWLMDSQREDGSIGPVQGEFFYNQAIAAMALCEAYALAPNERVKDAAKRAVDYLVRHQSSDPSGTGFLGWRYLPGTNESDSSATGWCAMALKSAELSGLGRYSGSMADAMRFLDRVTNGAYLTGYISREDAGQQARAMGHNEDFENHPALTAVAMCVRGFTQYDFAHPALLAGAKILIDDLPMVGIPGKKTKDYYYWYYATLAMHQFDGPDSPRKDGSLWKRWNEAMLKALTAEQKKKSAVCASGSWDPDDRWGFAGGRIYATALNTLTLEVYYRYPNAFLGRAKPGAEPSSKPK